MIADDMEKQPLIGMQGCIIFKIEESREEMGDIEKKKHIGKVHMYISNTKTPYRHFVCKSYRLIYIGNHGDTCHAWGLLFP